MEEPGGSADVVTQADLKLVRDQVDQLQLVLAKTRNPWYREPVNITSAMAAVVAVVSLFVSSHQGGQQQLREKREEFRSVLEQLVSMTDEENMLLNEGRNHPEKFRRLNSLRTSRDLFRSSAEMLAKDLGPNVLFTEYLIMGDQSKAANDNQKAGKYYDMALQTTNDPIDLNQAHRRHAWLYSSLLLRNQNEMRKRFMQALEPVKDGRNDLIRFTAGNTYADWGFQEYNLKNYDEALKRQKQAEQIFLHMSDEGRNKQSSLDSLRLDMGYTYMKLAEQARRSASYSLYGDALKRAEEAIAGISEDRATDKQRALADLRSLEAETADSLSPSFSTSLRPFRLWPGSLLRSPLPMESPQHQADSLGLHQP